MFPKFDINFGVVFIAEDPASVFGKGVAFFLGEPCETTCNKILFHVWCNMTTHRCECLPQYPVNVDNKYCIKGEDIFTSHDARQMFKCVHRPASRIDEPCEYQEACRYNDGNSQCSESGVCKCSDGFNPKFEESRSGLQCLPSEYHLCLRALHH